MEDEILGGLTDGQDTSAVAPAAPVTRADAAPAPSKFKFADEDGGDTGEQTGFFGKLTSNFNEPMASGTFGTLATGARLAGSRFNDDPEWRDYADYLLNQRALSRRNYEMSRWSETPAEWAGSAIGMLSAGALDPLSYINSFGLLGKATSTFGVPLTGAALRIGEFAFTQGLVNAGQDAVNQAVEYAADIRKEYSLAQTGLSFGMGMVIGGVFSGIGEVAARYAKYKTKTKGEDLERSINKPDADIAREDLARAAAEDPSLVSNDIQPPPREVPPVRVAETGEVVPPSITQPPAPRPDPEAVARQQAPDLFAKIDDLETRIDQTRAALDERLGQQAAEAPDLVAGRRAELEQELAGFTGKRRSSPRAEALRQELARLQEQTGGIVEAETQRFAADEQMLRLRLNDLQQQRAALGPEYRAAMERAQQDIAARPAETPPAAETPAPRGEAQSKPAEAAQAAPEPILGQTVADASPAKPPAQPAPSNVIPLPQRPKVQALDQIAAKVASGEASPRAAAAEMRAALAEARAAAQAAPQTPAILNRLRMLDDIEREIAASTGGSTPRDVEAAVRQAFGRDGGRLIDQGNVRIVQSVDQLPARPDGVAHPEDVKGLYDGKTAYLVADNLTPGEARGVLLHEVGTHAGLRQMLGDNTFSKVLAEVEAKAKAGDGPFAKAARAVPEDTPAAHRAEEILAYLVENAPELPLVQRVLASIRQWAYRLLGGRFIDLTEADLREMAVAALRNYRPDAQGRPSGVLYGRGTELVRTVQDLLKGAREAASWADWYDRYQDDLRGLFGTDADLFQKMLSATSQATSVPGNVTLALKAYRQFLEGKPFEGYLPAVIKNLERIRNDEALRGQKIAEYGKANAGVDDGIAVDRHIAELFYDVKSPSPAQVEAAKGIIRSIGEELGWKPRDVQAALWAYNQIRKGVEPASYDTYLKAKADSIAELRARFGRGEEGGVPEGGATGGSAGAPEGRVVGDGSGVQQPTVGEDPVALYSRRKKQTGDEIKAAEQAVQATGRKVVAADELDALVASNRIPRITVQDLVGKDVFPTVADRTAASVLYTGIDGSKLDIAIPMLGGPRYPFRESNFDAGVVWANRGDAITTRKADKAGSGAQYMMVVLGDANMHQSNTTVSNAYFGTFHAYQRDGRITPENAEKITQIVRKASGEDDNIKAALEGFPGFGNDKVLDDYVHGMSFEARKRLLNVLATKEVQSLGGPNFNKILDATRDPIYAGNNWGDGVLVVRIDADRPLVKLGEEGTTPHPDFPNGIRGEVVGVLDTPLNYRTLWRDYMAEQDAKVAEWYALPPDQRPGKKAPNPRRAFETKLPVVSVTQELIDSIGKYEAPNINSPRQARLAVDMATGQWKTSDASVKQGGVSPQAFLDGIANSDAHATLSTFELPALKKDIKSGRMRLYQLGDDGQIFFALKKGDPGYAADYGFTHSDIGPNEVTLTSVVNNEQGARGIGGPAVVLKALEEGATVLDAFAVKTPAHPEGFLPRLYGEFGFEKLGEIPFDPSYYTPLKLADAEAFWAKSGWVKDRDGYPPLTIMKWRGTDAERAGLTGRYARDGVEGLLTGRGAEHPEAVYARLLGDAGAAPEGGQAASGAGGTPGAQGDGNRASLASRAQSVIRDVAGLSDEAARNLGLSPDDVASVRDRLAGKYSRRQADPEAVARQVKALKSQIQGLDRDLAGQTDGDLQRRTSTAGAPARPGQQAAATAAPGETPEVLSLQQQSMKLAEVLDLPTYQGRVQGGQAVVGQFDQRQGVVRVRQIADFPTVAHEAAHAMEQRVGRPLQDLIQNYATELGPLDNTGNMNPREGFAIWAENWIINPATGPKTAPQFAQAFERTLRDTAPDVWTALTDAQAAHKAWNESSPGQKVGAIVQTQTPETVLKTLKEEGLPRSVSLAVAKIYDGLFDDKSVVTQAVRSIVRMARDASGVKISLEGADNPENLVRLFARNAQAATRDMLDGVRGYREIVPSTPGLRDAIIMATGQSGKLGVWDTEAVKTFSDYLVLRRAQVLYDRFDQGDLARRPLAMTKGDVLAGIAEMEAANPNLSAGAQMVRDYTRGLLKKMFDAGLIDADRFGKWIKEDFYVPFYRDMSDKPKAGAALSSSPEGPGKTDLVKRLQGSDRDIIDPIQSLMMQTFLVNRTVQHNDIIRSFVALARKAQSLGAQGTGRILEEIPAHELIGQKFNLQETLAAAAKKHGIDGMDFDVLTNAVADVFGSDPILATVFRAEPAGRKGEPIVFYKEGGELKAVRFTAGEEGMALYEALSQLPPAARDWALAVGQMSASALRAGIVTNPVFAITNYTRDQLAAAILRPNYLPFDPRGVKSELRQDRWAELYTYAGGVSPGAGAQGLHDMVDRSIDALAAKGWAVQKLSGLSKLVTGHGVERVAGPAKAIGELVETAEAGTRLNVMRTVFEQKKAQGLSEYDAMIEAAAQATGLMDFGRHGSGTLYIRTLVPFLNAHLQGIDKAWQTMVTPVYRALKGDLLTVQDEEALKNAGLTWFKMAGVGGALGYMYSLWAQNHRSYQDANDELRATHLIIPGSAFGYQDKILVIPKPFELAMGFNLGEMAGLALKSGDPRAASMALAGMMEVTLPPNVLSSIPIVKNFAELTLNKSFFTKRDIVPERLQSLKPEEQYTEKTSTFAKTIGSALGVSPIKVDYAIGAAFGLYGRDLLALSNTADPRAPAPSLYDQMFVRRFIKSADSASETTKRFWDQAAARNGQLAKAKASYENMLGQFRDEDAMRFLGALPKQERSFVVLNSAAGEDGKPAFRADDKRMHPLVRAATASTTISGMVRELSNDAQKVYEDGGRIAMDPQKRRDVIEQLRVLAAMEQYNALVIMKDKGYEGRRMEDTAKQLEVIRAHAPAAADEIATRYATAKIPSGAAIAKVWPEMERRLLADGSKADISDLTADVLAEGWEFGGERVKRPQKRRIEIPQRALTPAQ